MNSRSPFQWRPFAWNNLRAFFAGSPRDEERAQLDALYGRVKAAYERSPYADKDALAHFAWELVEEAAQRAGVTLPHDFDFNVKVCVCGLADEDPVLFGMPPFPDTLTLEGAGILRSVLGAKERFLSDPHRYEDIWREKVIRILEGFFGYLPPLPLEGQFSADIVNLCNAPEIVERIIVTLFDDDVVQADHFSAVRMQLEHNLLKISRVNAQEVARHPSSLLLPTKSDRSAREIPAIYLYGTAYARLFELSVPFSIPDRVRFEHQWVIAPSGSGKTQLLQSQIARDLEEVARGKASLIVIDSQPLSDGGFLSNIARLKVFAPGGPLDGKLVFLRPEMSEPGAKKILTPALNVFDVGQHNPDLSARERQVLQSSALKMITFALSDTSGQQEAMIRYLVQLGMEVPDVTIDTIRRMVVMPPQEFLSAYGDILSRVPEVVRDYFLHLFHKHSLNVTREAVARRLMELLSNPTFAAMFQNSRNTINVRREIESGKVILIHTDKALLDSAGCELFGRFFISLILQATLQRSNDLPVYCYVDECADYIAAEESVATLIDQARKQRCSFVWSHQRLDQVRSPNVLSALSTCAIKFATRNEDDSRVMARYLRCEPAFIADMPKLSFACHIRDTTKGAVKIDVEPGVMEKMERMTDSEYAEVLGDMRERYCNTERSPAPSAAPPGPVTAPPEPRPGRRATDAEWEDVV